MKSGMAALPRCEEAARDLAICRRAPMTKACSIAEATSDRPRDRFSWSVSETSRWVATPAGAAGGAPRLELHDLVLRVGNALMVHTEELRDEGLLRPADVAESQVALV